MKRLALVIALIVPTLAAAQEQCFVRNNTATTTVAPENLRPARASVNANGELFITGSASATSITKAEDAAHTSADAGVMALGVANDISNQLNLSDAYGDYTPLAVNKQGTAQVDINVSGIPSAHLDTSISKAEDGAAASADGGVNMLAMRDDTLSVDTSAEHEYGELKLDKFGRLQVSTAPQAHLFSCVSAADVTDTSAASLCAADADELFVITSACCSNSDTAVGTIVHIQDETGPTVVHAFFLSPYVAAAPGSSNECQTFPSGIKMAAVNKAIQMINITNSAQTRCAIQGYKLPS